MQRLILAQILAHLSILPMLWFGSATHYALAICVYFLTGSLGMSATYHRYLSHRAWQPPRWFECVGGLLGTLGLCGSGIAWSAVHRTHHGHTDKEGDPHSPKLLGFWRAHFLSLRHLPNMRIVSDLLRDPVHRFLHERYWAVNLAYAGILAAIDPFAVVYLHLFPAAILWNSSASINSFCHVFGYKNFALENEARNNAIFGFLSWGEGWHNNHHAEPRAASFQRRWFEIDITARVIRGVEILHAPFAHMARRNQGI